MSISRHKAPTDNEESGFTLPELLVVVLITGIVMIALFSSMTSVVSATARTDARTQTLNETRQAMETITRDLRAANPIDALGTVADYDRVVQFEVYCKTGTPDCTNNLRQVQYGASASRLNRVVGGGTRPLLLPQGPSGLPDALRRGSLLNTATEPVFTYFLRDGTQIRTSGASASPSTTFRDCAKTVRIHLKVRADSNDANAVVNLTTDVALRNYNEVSGC